MKVSICSITYNHGRFIQQAIESWLMQKTNFEIEIIISDDKSKDETVDLITEYASKDPRIKLIANEKNIGMMPNFIQALKACTGDYIALCEGDDYWIDENKLQEQVDFLEQHKDYSICFHKAKLVYDDGVPHFYSDINADTPVTTTLYDLVKGNYIHTPTCVFRKNFSDFPDWFVNVPTGDWALHILNAEYGKIHFIKEEMGAYRIHYGGVLSTKKERGPHDFRMTEMFGYLAGYFKNKQTSIHRWFRELHYHQKAYYFGIENETEMKMVKRMALLLKCGYLIRKPKLMAAAFMLPFLPGKRLSKVWSAAHDKKKKLGDKA
jgi:glycosyltransferase involved in cell wall biosynthesis